MKPAFPTAPAAYGLNGPSATVTVDNATPQGSTYRRGKSVQTNGTSSVLPGLRILGCTLWSGFDLYGPSHMEVGMNEAKRGINDYRMIRTSGGQYLKPLDTVRLHRLSTQWLTKELSKPFDGKTVVVTHFAPHRRCVAPLYDNSVLSPYFVTDLSRLMATNSIDVWCHGHTHTNYDFVAENGCRVISNQAGYPNELSRSGFRADLIIEGLCAI